MALRTLLTLCVAAAVVGVLSLPLQAQQVPPVEAAGAEELPAPPEPQPIVPPPPIAAEVPPALPPAATPLPYQQEFQQPLPLHRPMVIQRSDSYQKSFVYQKVSHLPSYRVTYHDHHRLRRPCCPMAKITIAIPDPLRPGCVAEICVKAPACVKGHPQVAESPGFLGRGVVTLCWPNGHRVRVVFKKLAPHLLVHTYPA